MANSDFKTIMVILIGILITAVLIGSIADQVVNHTETQERVNDSVTTATTANTTVELTGGGYQGTPTVNNGTTDITTIANFTFVDTETCDDGLLCVQIKTTDDAIAAGYNNSAINVTYEMEPDGYITSSGVRAVTKLIIIFSALAIVIFTIVYMFMSDSLKNLMRR